MNSLIKVMESEGIELTDKCAEKFEQFRQTLLETNKYLNLTSITEEEEVNYKHFLDSLLPMKKIEFKENAKVIDIGTGGGFPGLPMKFYRDDLDITLLDSLNKRIKFLKDTIYKMELSNKEAIHGRAE